MSGRAVRWAVLCSWLLTAGAAHAQGAPKAPSDPAASAEELARHHFQLGRAQYESGQFREAAANFERAYELSEREVLWYNIYLAYRDAGDNAAAALALNNYLTHVQHIENRDQLEARLRTLERQLAEERERAAQQAAPSAATPAATSSPAPSDTAGPSAGSSSSSSLDAAAPKRSILPYVVMGVGGAMVIGGLVTGAMASSKSSELEEMCPDRVCDPSLQPLANEGKSLALVADLLLFGGLAVGAGGVLWFLLDPAARSAEESSSAVQARLACGPGACAGSMALRF